ncbi:MAG: hypothetical protein JO257_07480 [Deltaproteobacteria bacterium]|nr:hypothetical protein [Deltaproteobacteria bacterium]
MTRQAVVDEERTYVERLIVLRGLDVVAGPVHQAPPRPDYWFQLADGRCIAVEVTKALETDVEAGNRGARPRLKRMIHDALARDGLNVHVHLSIPIYLASRLENAEVAHANVAAIVALARQVAASDSDDSFIYEDVDEGDSSPLRTKTRHRRQYAGDLKSHGIHHIDWVLIARSDEPLVTTGGGAMGGGAHVLQQAIDDKREKYARYVVDNADECWLLVVGSAGSTPLDVSVTEHRTFESPFARTMFLELFEDKCVELRTTVPPVGAEQT